MNGRASRRRRPRPSVGRMGDAKVYVIDHVVTRPGRAREFGRPLSVRVRAGAAERGYDLDRLLISPPIWFADESNTVTACWELAGTGLVGDDLKGRPDKSLGEVGRHLRELVESRTRTMASSADDVEDPCDV